MRISQKNIERLLTQQPTAPAVTIYLPTHKNSSPPHMTEDQIRLKNLVNKAVDILKNRDDGRDVELAMCDRLEELLADKSFWENQTDCLLICARPGMIETFNVPIDSEEYVAVDTHFHLAPILGLLTEAQEYYVLSIAQHAPALYEGDMYDLYPVKNLELPETLETGLNIDEMNQKSEQQRSTGGDTGGFNGRGGAKNPADAERQRFWRMIDQLVLNKVNTKLPLILAGVESETVEYRDQSHYPHLLQGTIRGSFSGVNPHDLFAPAWDIIEREVIKPMHKQVLETYARLHGENPARTVDDVAAVIDAAEAGKIDTLLVGMRRYTTDTVQDNNYPVSRLTFPGPDPSKAIHDLAQQVWAQHGQVINLEDTQMPAGAAMAAILRY